MKNSALHVTAIVPYKIFPAEMGGQKANALFYHFFSIKTATTIVSTKNNETPPVNLASEFLPILSNSSFRYINPLLFFTIKKIIKKRESTHLFLEHPYLGWLGLLIKILCRVKLVIHSHNIESLRFKSTGKWWWRILWYYECFVHRNADVNFFITDEDKKYAIEKFNLDANKCHTITYGFHLKNTPTPEEKKDAKLRLQNLYGLSSKSIIILFNGTLDYKPNVDALEIIINHINPILNKEKAFNYTIIICGKNLPPHYNNLDDYKEKNLLYAGFVNDISLYFKGADIFINPVLTGGGIKTKLVEALGFDLFCVSTKEGAFGVPASITNHKLTIIDDNNWIDFTNAITQATLQNHHIDQKFFNHFYWEEITRKACTIINNSIL